MILEIYQDDMDVFVKKLSGLGCKEYYWWKEFVLKRLEKYR